MFDALVLLGCRVGASGALTDTARRRVDRAARAFASGLAPRIIVSGGRRWDRRAEAEVFAQALVRRGVPDRALILELLSFSTCENARYSLAIARDHGFERIGVVTCDWHMRRALAAFARAGVSAEPIAAITPASPISERVVRTGRERVSFWLDCFATWGATSP